VLRRLRELHCRCSFHRANRVGGALDEFEGYGTTSVATVALPRLSWSSLKSEEHEALGTLVARRMRRK
jgi:hypothetical protein